MKSYNHFNFDKINKYQCILMVNAINTTNQKELNLINCLEDLLNSINLKTKLNKDYFIYSKFKTSRVVCFSEKYFEIVNYIEDYLKLYQKFKK